MFDFLKKKMDSAIESTEKKVREKKVSEKDLELEDLKISLLESDVGFETTEKIIENLKNELIGKRFKRKNIKKEIKNVYKNVLLECFSKKTINLKKKIKQKRPYLILLLGFNGSGKTTSLVKLAYTLKDRGVRPVIAAADTFRAASIEQLEKHAEKLGLKVIKHRYGSDSAAVVFDAVKHAKSKGMDTVLADTAGRTHTNKNLMDELKKVCKVNKPDLKLLVIDSLTGNDAVFQAEKFEREIGIDGVVMTKMDVNEKGGAALSVAEKTGKPILYMGTGQEYKDLKKFKPKEFVEKILG